MAESTNSQLPASPETTVIEDPVPMFFSKEEKPKPKDLVSLIITLLSMF